MKYPIDDIEVGHWEVQSTIDGMVKDDVSDIFYIDVFIGHHIKKKSYIHLSIYWYIISSNILID